MSNYKSHAMQEFQAAGWLDENGKYINEMQEQICNHLLKLMHVFADEGHSGYSASYTIGLFSKLAKFEPIAPLTGEDWEWTDVAVQSGYPLYQNKRCSTIFKDVDGAYNINGKVFYDWYTDADGVKSKSYYTSKDSRVPVAFPYIKEEPEYVERVNYVDE